MSEIDLHSISTMHSQTYFRIYDGYMMAFESTYWQAPQKYVYASNNKIAYAIRKSANMNRMTHFD